MTKIGAYEAKTKLPELLKRVMKGERITITKHGVPVAKLQPADPRKIIDDLFIAEIQDFSEICELFIIIFDFIDFEEQALGEKRNLKDKIQELKQEFHFQFIPVENEEELYFIIKSVLESPSGRRS